MPAMDKRGLTFGPCLSTGGHRHFLYRKKLFPRPGRFASQLATSIPVDGRRARPSDIPGIRNELNREPANQLKGVARSITLPETRPCTDVFKAAVVEQCETRMFPLW
jgi:hypothetical protein